MLSGRAIVVYYFSLGSRYIVSRYRPDSNFKERSITFKVSGLTECENNTTVGIKTFAYVKVLENELLTFL